MNSGRICHFYLHGRCSYGQNCKNFHPNYEDEEFPQYSYNESRGGRIADVDRGNRYDYYEPRGRVKTNNYDYYKKNAKGNTNIENINDEVERRVRGNKVPPYSSNNSKDYAEEKYGKEKNNKSLKEKYKDIWKIIESVHTENIWPYSCVGEENESNLFECENLNFEEFRWKFYETPRNQWNSLQAHLLNQLENSRKQFLIKAMQDCNTSLSKMLLAPITSNPFGNDMSISASGLQQNNEMDFLNSSSVITNQNSLKNNLHSVSYLCSFKPFSNNLNSSLNANIFSSSNNLFPINSTSSSLNSTFSFSPFAIDENNSMNEVENKVQTLVDMDEVEKDAVLIREDTSTKEMNATEAFLASHFEEGKIPESIPPPHLCNFGSF